MDVKIKKEVKEEAELNLKNLLYYLKYLELEDPDFILSMESTNQDTLNSIHDLQDELNKIKEQNLKNN